MTSPFLDNEDTPHILVLTTQLSDLSIQYHERSSRSLGDRLTPVDQTSISQRHIRAGRTGCFSRVYSSAMITNSMIVRCT